MEKGHGRREIRRIWTSTDLKNYLDFPHHKQVARIERITRDLRGNPSSSEVAYCITSLTPPKAGPEKLLNLNRGHWSIENSLHYVRDVTFDEDRCRARTGSGPRVMATLRNLSLSLLRLNGHTDIPRSLRTFAERPHLSLRLVGL